MERNKILKVKAFFEQNMGKPYKLSDLIKTFKINDNMFFEIVGIRY